jgi:3-hydroxyisobutyrate dehydrogenase-like beta-hydroxyacid dehydrogenase
MDEISLIGLGAMGSALGRALLRANRKLTVWNRTDSRMEPLVALGANAAASVADAVKAAPRILICIEGYAAAEAILGAAEVVTHLSGRTLIQLSTGTPREAREAEARARQRGADYIDGAIMAYPGWIGRADTLIFVAGALGAVKRCRPYVDDLGGDVRYLGANVALASTLDFALLSKNLGLFLGTAHGARICESEGVAIEVFASMLPDGDRAKKLLQIMHTSAYENPGATITIWEKALQRIQQQAHEARINHEVPDFVSGLLRRAIASGHGKEDVAALVKVLRTTGGP